MFASYRPTVICGIALLTLGLAGCGQKGPLFMPVKSASPIAKSPAPATGTPAVTPAETLPPATAPSQPLTPAPVTPQSPAMTPPQGTVVPSNK